MKHPIQNLGLIFFSSLLCSMAYPQDLYKILELALENVFPRDDISGDISAISAPTLVIVGELDRATPPEKAQRIVDAIPGARLVTVADSGHHSPIENPEAVNRALSDFLATL